jgi:coenzyme F420 hydrogenase subunit delta
MKTEECAPEYCLKPTLILGCGNVLRGDDGFGPQVIAHLRQRGSIPEDVAVLDAGTGVGEILLDIGLFPENLKRIAVVDALDCGQPAGTISVLPLARVPQRMMTHLSLHQEPSARLLRELEELGAKVTLVTVQPESIPDSVRIGLSAPVERVVSQASELIVKNFFYPQCMNG